MYKKLIVFLLLLILPFSVFAYSDYIIASGKSVGIKINTKGVIVAGSYNINNIDNLKESKLKVGDILTKANGNSITNINDMVDIINNCNCDNINLEYIRDDKTYKTNLKLYEIDNNLKTGLYVKDTISGIGTLTFVDPNTKLFGVLGHEIINADTGEIVKIESGSIYNADITNITKSKEGNPGEKNAIIYSKDVKGNISENTTSGIFGEYLDNIDDSKLYKVVDKDEIKTGKAKILTVTEKSNIEEYDINIISVKDTKDNLRNILFEITDKELLDKTNGIVQGMSGSPIIQGNNIIGAVTHVVVDDPHKGYGIFITNMLKEAEN